MKTSCLRPTSVQSTAANILVGVIFAAGLTAMTAPAALGAENDARNLQRRAQQAQHDRVQRKSIHRQPQYGYNQRYQRANRSYGYADPAYVYAPPPVVYEPRPSPGISLFFSF